MAWKIKDSHGVADDIAALQALPTRLGIKMNPWLHSVILISKGARITRPKTKIDGLDCIVKSDQLRTLIERSIDSESAASALMTMGKLLSSEALEILHDEWPGCTAPCAAIGTRFWSV